MIKKILAGLGGLLLLLLVWQYELVAYGIGQARGQLKVIWNARPVEEVLEDPQVPDSLKQKIRLAQEVRDFAIDSLGVNDSDSYRTLYDQQGKPILWVVTACEPYSMEDKKWSFPIIGEFSYKGFFDYEKALEEKALLDEAGYDTGIRTVSAWSTLGILDDPLMSGLLFRSEGELANTIVHELTHATLFVRDDLRFNENLASFVGNRGAEAFLKHKYGTDAAEYNYYINYLYDRRLFAEHMLAGVDRLDSLYQSFTEDIDVEEKERLKQQEIGAILQEAKELDFKNQRYRAFLDSLLEAENLPNNTFFKSYVRYQADLDTLEKEFEEDYGEDIKSYLAYLKQKYGK
jgi:predicted aminopeptidase